MEKFEKKQIRLVVLTLTLVCLYPCLYMYFANITETSPLHVILPILVFGLFAAFMEFVAYKIVKEIYKSTILTTIAMILFINYSLLFDMVNTRFPFVGNKIFFPVCILLVGIFYLFIRNIKDELDWICEIICVVFAGLIVFNFVGAIPKVFAAKTEAVKPVELKNHGKDTGFKENVYYLVLDEYGGTDNLDYYYNFDNSKFLKSLEKKGFVNSDSTYNYEGIYTKEILPNILNFEYVAHPGDKKEQNGKYLKNPAMYRFFEEMGYDINVINHQNFIDSDSDDCNEIFSSKSKNVKTNPFDIERYIYENSFLKSLQRFAPKLKVLNEYGGYRKEVNKAFDIFAHGYEYSKDKPTFTIAYLMTPHRPFVFDENGNAIDYRDAKDWTKKDVYINQLKYINKKVDAAVGNIIKNDPNAVIVIQSDHGARYGYFCMNKYSKSKYNAEKETKKMQNVINCVYWGSANKHDIEGLSCLNTWRTVLNELYDAGFDMIDVPHKHVVKWKYKNTME